MKILVTGATGYIGFSVASALRRAGHDVYGMHRSPESAKKLEAAEIRPVRGDLESLERAEPVARECGALVHVASAASADRVALDRRAVDLLVAWAQAAPLPRTIVYTSGVWVYGTTGAELVDESSALRPLELVTWRPGHEAAILAATDGKNVRPIVIRPGCVYGGRGGLTGGWFEGATKEGAPKIVGDGSNRWTLVHVEDLADLYVRAIERAPSAGGIFSAVDRSRETVFEMARAAALAAGASGEVRTWPLEEARKKLGPYADCLAIDQRVDGGKAERLLSWRPKARGFRDDAALYFAAWRAGR
jgi:nucleoside-diphosphate-sugar epimerase